MKTKQTLREQLSISKNMKFLFLGREGVFSHEEIVRFLKKYAITLTKEYEDGVVATIEHHSLTPIEEDISCMVYDANIPSFTLSNFEEIMSKNINDDELLMGIKLSNDQERIFRLLGNTHISEQLFLKLLMLYNWHDEEEDNRDDRDVIMYTLRRYINIKPNEEDLLYSYLTLRRLATEASNPKLLLALIQFHNYTFLIRGKEKITLRETIARNNHLDKEVITKLLSLRDEKIEVALASNAIVETTLLHTLLNKDIYKINEALATNKNIDNEIFITLLNKEDKIVQLLLLSQPIDLERLSLIENANLALSIYATLGANQCLALEVIEKLIEKKSDELMCYLAENEMLTQTQLHKIYDKSIEITYAYLAHNPSLSVEKLEKLYQMYDEPKIYIALAQNRSTPEAILRALFDKDEFEIYQSMASNASVPMDLLDILKVDTRLQNALAKNEIFVKEYETVLDYDKNAVQF